MSSNEATRYGQFCQFKTEIRGSREYLIVGIDAAKDKHQAFFGTATGKTVLRRLIFENSRAGFQQLVDRARQLQAVHQLPKLVFGLEPTGNYHKPLANWLLENDQPLVLVSNKAIRENRELLDGRWDKNDTKDSANVADLISQGKCQFFEQPGADLSELRSLLGYRKRLKKQEHALRMQIRNGLLAKYFPELDRLWGNRLQENLAILRWCLDPREIAAMEFEAFMQRVAHRNTGAKQVRRLRAIWKVAAVSIGCPVTGAAVFEARQLADRLEDVRERIKQTEALMAEVAQRFGSYKLLLTIPGVGPYIASIVLAAIGDADRFDNRKQVIRLAGLDLNAKRSGKRSQAAPSHISKRGNADLRYAIYQAALIASYHDERLRALFVRYLQGREKEQGIKTKMRVKLAAKLLVIAWTMMKNQTAFNPALIQV